MPGSFDGQANDQRSSVVVVYTQPFLQELGLFDPEATA